MYDIKIRKIISYILGFGILLIGISQLFPWANWKDSPTKIEIYPWAFHGYGSNLTGGSKEEYIFFYEFITEGNFTKEQAKEIRVGMMALFLFPISLITSLLGLVSINGVKKKTISYLPLFSTVVFALFTLILFYFFIREWHTFVPGLEIFFNWWIGFYLFLIGTIIFFVMSIYIHYRYYPLLI